MKPLRRCLYIVLLMLTPSALFSQTKDWIVYSKSDTTLLGNQIMSVAIDSNSNKWIATYGGNGGINEFSYDWSDWSGLTFGSVYALAVDTSNTLWAGTGGIGLGRYHNGVWRWYRSDNSILPSNYVLAISVDRDNSKWIGTDKGLVKLSVSSGGDTTWTLYTTKDGLPSDYVNSVAIDSGGTVWVGTSDGVGVFNGTSWTVDTTGNSGMPSNFVWAITVDDSGNFWVGTNKGLAEYNGTRWNTYLSGDNIRALAADDSGNIWAGIYGGGVEQFNGHSWTSHTTSNSGLPNNLVNSITVDPKGNKWIGTDGGGLAVYNAGGVDQSFTPPGNPPPPSGPVTLDKNYIVASEARYIDSCVASSGAIILARNQLTTFQGTPHYKISPYFSNFAADALLRDPSTSNLAIVKNWMTWVFNHLNADGSIYDYYVDSLRGGTDQPSVDAYPGENIPDFDSQDSYAATFLTLARKYLEAVPVDTSWLRGYSSQLSSIGNALYATIDDSAHYFHQFSPDNNDGLSVAKLNYQVKYTMDNSEVNEGLNDMVWLEQHVIAGGDPSFYRNLLENNTAGFANLWDSTASAYYVYEGSAAPNWNEFYPDAECQLWPILCGVISPASSRANALYDIFNSHYPAWQNGNPSEAPLGYIAALMNDTTRVDSYLLYVQKLLEEGLNIPGANVAVASWIIRAAQQSTLTAVTETRPVPSSFRLEQNYPNPFNPTTAISYHLAAVSRVSLKIYDVLGREVATLVNARQNAGDHTITFNASGLASGVYFYRLVAKEIEPLFVAGRKGKTNFISTRKMVLIE